MFSSRLIKMVAGGRCDCGYGDPIYNARGLWGYLLFKHFQGLLNFLDFLKLTRLFPILLLCNSLWKIVFQKLQCFIMNVTLLRSLFRQPLLHACSHLLLPLTNLEVIASHICMGRSWSQLESKPLRWSRPYVLGKFLKEMCIVMKWLITWFA